MFAMLANDFPKTGSTSRRVRRVRHCSPMGEQFAIVRQWATSSPLKPMGEQGAWDYKNPWAWLDFP